MTSREDKKCLPAYSIFKALFGKVMHLSFGLGCKP